MANGVRPRGNSILIDFSYRGIRCRETLRTKPTKTALKEATRKREAILHAIAMGNFDYADYFPNSSKAKEYSRMPGKLITIESALKNWLKKAERRCQYSTIKGYNSVICHHLIPNFGPLQLTQLTPKHIEDWILTLNVSNKRINNILGPLRQVYKDAFFDQIISKNPMERIRYLPVDQREPSPFSNNEISSILKQLTGQTYNLFLFAFWSGLRTSELIALRWQDVDFKNNRFHVRVAIVEKKEKSTKTVSGNRTITLNSNSKTALQNQLNHTQENVRVFHDPHTDQPWKNDQIIRKRVWIPALQAASINYRNPYQTRHTFASMMLSQGKNPMWVANQMGHKDWGMIRKIYGRWISNEN